MPPAHAKETPALHSQHTNSLVLCIGMGMRAGACPHLAAFMGWLALLVTPNEAKGSSKPVSELELELRDTTVPAGRCCGQLLVVWFVIELLLAPTPFMGGLWGTGEARALLGIGGGPVPPDFMSAMVFLTMEPMPCCL
jgi:hypothetical protein